MTTDCVVLEVRLLYGDHIYIVSSPSKSSVPDKKGESIYSSVGMTDIYVPQ